MKTAQSEFLERAQVLKMAQRLLRNTPEFPSVAESNSALVDEWLEELMATRDKTQRELNVLDQVIANLRNAQAVKHQSIAA